MCAWRKETVVCGKNFGHSFTLQENLKSAHEIVMRNEGLNTFECITHESRTQGIRIEIVSVPWLIPGTIWKRERLQSLKYLDINKVLLIMWNKFTYSCTTCERSCFRKTNLRIHISNVHNDNRQFVCETCGHAYSPKQSLHKHK